MNTYWRFVWWLNFCCFVANVELTLWFLIALDSFLLVSCIVALMNLTCCIFIDAKEHKRDKTSHYS